VGFMLDARTGDVFAGPFARAKTFSGLRHRPRTSSLQGSKSWEAFQKPAFSLSARLEKIFDRLPDVKTHQYNLAKQRICYSVIMASSGLCSSSVDIQPRDLALIRDLFESRIMTIRHVAALHFDGSKEAAKKRLQKLKAAGFITDRPRKPNESAILFLTRKALGVLRDNGVLADYPQFSVSALDKRAQVSALTIHHELEVMDVKAAFCTAVRGIPIAFRATGLTEDELPTPWTPLSFSSLNFRPSGLRTHHRENLCSTWRSARASITWTHCPRTPSADCVKKSVEASIQDRPRLDTSTTTAPSG